MSVFFGATSTTKPWSAIKSYAFPPDDGRAASGPIPGTMTPLLEGLVGTWETTLKLAYAEF